MTECYSSLFLTKMQNKREDQLRCITAYRLQSTIISTALLSEVAREFYKRMSLSTTMNKEGIKYHDVFNGKAAVDCLMSILKLNERLEALDVGCALRNQNFFHDVNYELNLIDSIDELYQFKDMVDAPKDEHTQSTKSGLDSSDLPQGIYIELTNCYSTTCTGDQLCYSWSCPKKRSLKPNCSQSKVQVNSKEEGRLWSHSIPDVLLKTTLPEEVKRQECIYELIYTEQDFVRDLQYCHDFWIEPLLTQDIIPEHQREQFVNDVFYNIQDIKKVNQSLSDALNARRAEKYLVSSIGDILLEHVNQFQPFIDYGSHQVIGKFTFELEKKRNTLFNQFTAKTERRPESRRLELNGYLTKPTTRLGRYNLLLKEILKVTPIDNPDTINIPKVMDQITFYLQQVNIEAGKCENLFNLKQIGERLEFRSASDYIDLKLEKPGRQLLMKGRMKRKETSSEASDLQVFLFDHYLVFAKIKYEDHVEKYKTFRRPIPLDLLSIGTSLSTTRPKRASSILPYNRPSLTHIVPKHSTSETLLPSHAFSNLAITFNHHGRKGTTLTLYSPASSVWIKTVRHQLHQTRPQPFTIRPLVQHPTRPRITTTWGDPSHLLIGTDTGVYRDLQPIIQLEKVSQIEQVDDQLLVLADKTVWTFEGGRGRVVSSHTSFMHIGDCLGRRLLCLVRTGALSATTIRVLERSEEKKKSMFQLKKKGWKSYRDLYYPNEASSIRLLKTQICITSQKGIGVVDMKTFGVQPLLDPKDQALEFVFQRPDLKPMDIYRIESVRYLVCYNEFAFCVDQRGCLIKSSARINWEGIPDSFALSYPYILAFEPEMIEIHHIETGELEQVVKGKNIKCTNKDTFIQCTMDDPENEGYQLVFQLEKK